MWHSTYEIGMQILGHYGYEGFTPGSFFSSLLITWEKADYTNRARLAEGFPELANEIEIFQRMSPEDYASRMTLMKA